MISTVYLHPDRTLRATWNVDQGDLTLLSFDDNARLDRPDDGNDGTDDNPTTVVLHTSAVLFHRYPVDAEEDHARRRFFEIITCLPPLSPRDHVIDIAMPGQLHGSTWHGVFVIPEASVPEGFIPKEMHVDILEDIRAVRIARLMADNGTTLLVGRRGNVWWCAVLDSTGAILHLVQSPVHDLFEDAVEVRDLVLEVCGSMNLRAERVVLFGDTLTKAVFDNTKIALEELVPSVVRLNPFSSIQANVDAQTQQRCVRLAHILGPLVGPLPLPMLHEH